MLSDMISNDVWTKSKTACLYRYNPNGQYFARVRFGGKLHRKKLGTDDYQLARRKLADFRRDLGRTDGRASNTSFGTALDKYARTFGGLSPSSQKDKRAVIGKLKATWFGIDTLPLRTIKPSDVSAWLSRHCGNKGASYHNSVLTVIRDAFDLAVKDRIIADSPAAHLKYRRRAAPIRLTPTFDQFKHDDAAKALSNACKRLGLPPFTHRALRRMFIVRAIERGVDVKVIAEWQGHRDGGKLILNTYSHVRRPHSERMAALMTDGEPENVIPITAQA